MKDFGTIIGFLLILLIFAVVTGGGSRPLFDNTTGTSTEPVSTSEELLQSSGETISAPEEPATRLSDRETEERLQELSRTLGELKEDVREARLRAPASPYQGLVTLGNGNAYETSWSREYLTVSVDSDAPRPIDVTGWYLESRVTEEQAKLPFGDRVLEDKKKPAFERIVLLPGEEAYLITGRSPLKTSFHENLCTGYLDDTKDFYPSIDVSCPRPLDDMKQFSRVAFTNDDCYDFVGSIGTCEILDKDIVDETRITNTCSNFILEDLTYEGCVRNHKTEPLFDDVGSWYIYLNRTRDLWRSEREIIRLMDANGKVVDVIEY